MKIPSNLSISDYTVGGELYYADTQKEYQGYYCLVGSQYFAGEEPNTNNPLLIRKDSFQYNTLLDNPNSKTYSLISRTTSQDITSPSFTSIPQSNQLSETQTYYAKKLNVIPVSIKQIDKTTYDSLQSNPFYQTVFLTSNRSNINQAEKQMPGLKAFLGIS